MPQVNLTVRVVPWCHSQTEFVGIVEDEGGNEVRRTCATIGRQHAQWSAENIRDYLATRPELIGLPQRARLQLVAE
jgi:hypothetical protein